MRAHVGCDIFAADMTTDFTYLDKLQVRADRTARFVFQQVRNPDGTCPTLVVAPATNENAPFFAAQLELTAGSVARGARIDPEQVARFRRESRQLYPIHVVRGWDHVFSAKGEPVPFSAEACASFLRALPDWLFDQLRVFCESPINFTAAGHASPLDGAAIAKN